MTESLNAALAEYHAPSVDSEAQPSREILLAKFAELRERIASGGIGKTQGRYLELWQRPRCKGTTLKGVPCRGRVAYNIDGCLSRFCVHHGGLFPENACE